MKMDKQRKGIFIMRSFQEAVVNRRTNYALGKQIEVLPAQIIEVVENLVKEVPSSFNMQSARVVVAFGDNHDKIWNITKKTSPPAESSIKFTRPISKRAFRILPMRCGR